MPAHPINVAVVDDHNLFLKTLAKYLSEQDNLRVVVQSSNMIDLLSRLNSSPVEVLIMDIFMPHLNGYDALKQLRSEYSSIKILVLSMSTDMDMISDMLEVGIHGYVSKADEPENLLRAISTVAEGRIYRNILLTEALYWNKRNSIGSYIGGSGALLNEREKKILQLIWEEKSSKEIADLLFLGIRSIEKIRQDMKEKTGIKSTVGLLKYALARKIIRVDPRLSVNNAVN
jgi:DNA-binding NarL/FixJ family response regulator